METFCRQPRTRAQHLANLLVLGGPLGPFKRTEDLDRLREQVYGVLDDESFAALVATALAGSERPSAWLEDLLAEGGLLAEEREDVESVLDRLRPLPPPPSARETQMAAPAFRQLEANVPFVPSYAALGVLAPEVRVEAFYEAVERLVLPRLGKLGLNGERAWRDRHART